MTKTLDQNFSYGYDGGLYNLRTSPDSKFECHYQKAKYMPSLVDGYKEEAIKICNHISDYAIANKQIPTILLSGGLDSEVVVRAFIDSGREFQCVTHRFANDLNKHEIEYIDYFCKSKTMGRRWIRRRTRRQRWRRRWLCHDAGARRGLHADEPVRRSRGQSRWRRVRRWRQ